MKALIAILVGLGFSYPASALELRVSVRAASAALSAQDLREWEPDRINTYRELGAARVTVAWRGLRVVAASQGLSGFVAMADGVEAVVEWGMRAQGPWYHARGGCDSVREFVALEGQSRAERLARALRESLPKLRKMLAEISRAGSVLEGQVFASDVLESWVSLVRADFVAKETKKVLSANAQACTPSKKEWASFVEPLKVRDPGAQPLARVPLQWFGKSLTAKVGLDVGGRKISGRFLIDPSSSRSLISAEWVRNQGIWLFEVLREGSFPGRYWASWGGGVGITLEFDFAEISGLALPVHKFLSAQTELLFDEDLYARGCCDGVLGGDVFRHLNAEFEFGATPRMLLWSTEDTSLPLGATFLEAYESDAQGVVSRCGSVEVSWVFFKPQSQVAKNTMRKDQKLCDFLDNSIELETLGGQVAPFQTVADRVILDLPRGRVAWVSKAGLHHRTNESGIEVQSRFLPQEGRKLELTRIRSDSPAGALTSKLGVRQGATLLKINGRSVSELDRDQVDAILSGRDGDRVELWVDRKKREAPVAMSFSLTPRKTR